MPHFEEISEGHFRKTVGPGDVENRIMSSYDVVWQSIAELHGEGVVGDVMKVVQIDEFFDGSPDYIGRVELEQGVGYVNGKRVSELGQVVNIPTPYRTIVDEVLIEQGAGDMQTTWVCSYPPLVDDDAITLKRVNSTTGVTTTLTRYDDYTINPDTGVVSLDAEVSLNEYDQLLLTYRSRVPMIWWVELHQGGEVYLHAGDYSDEPPATDTYNQSAYNDLYAIPPTTATTDTIVIAEVYVPGDVPSNGFANMEEDSDRSLSGLTTSQIASGDYGVIRDMRTILTPAEEVLQFQEDFYNMQSDMEDAVEKADEALYEVRVHDAEFESEGVKKTSWSDTLNLYRGLRVEGNSGGFGSSEMASGDQSLSVIPGVCYIAQTIDNEVFLMRVPVSDTQQVTVEEVGDTAGENRQVREDINYQDTQALYDLSTTPVTSLLDVKGEIHYDYTFDRSALTTPFSYSSAFSGGLPTADPTQTSPAFEATLTEFTDTQLQKILSANGVSVETQSAVDANQYAQQVFAFEHSDLDKLHTISIRWDGYGDQYDGADHHYGATVYVWNNTDDTWEVMGQVTGNSIGTVQVTLTSNLSNYFVNGEKLYVLVAADTPADGSQAAQLWTDYMRVGMYVGRYVGSDHTQAASFPSDSYEQNGNQVEWIDGEFLPRNATGFWVDYRTPLPRYDLVQIGLDGQAEVKKGTPSTTPSVPTLDEEHIQLAHVYVLGNLVIKNEADAVSGSNGVIYDDRVFIWNGEEGIAAREDADTLLENLINRTKETSADPNFVVSGLEVEPYPDAEGSDYIRITDGIYYCNGERIVVSGLSPYQFTFDTLDLNLHRKDIITIDADQVIHQYIGDPDLLQNAVDLPSFPDDEVLLAYIEVTGQMVEDQVVLGSSISNSQPKGGLSDQYIQRANELEGDGVLYDDVSIAPASPRSRNIDLQVDSAGIIYIDGRRVEVTGESNAGQIQPMSAEQYDWEDSTDFHPFQSGLNEGSEDEWFNIDSVLSPPMELPLESIKSIEADALCDLHFRRPFGSQYTHQAWHLSYPDLSIDPTAIPGGTPVAAIEFSDDGFDASNMPNYNDGDNSYQNMMFSDGVRAEKEGSPTAGHYAQHIFKFHHIENEGSVSKLHFIWHGQGHRANIDGTTSYGVQLQVWNANDGAWEQLADSSTDNEGIGEDEMILTGTISSSLSDYLTSNGNIWLRAYCTLPAADGFGASIITDYIECQVTESNRLMVGNKIRNSDFEYGLDRPYDWEFSGDGTVSWITSESDSEVNQHCFRKYYPYIWHEFSDNETIGDAYANDPRTRSLRISSNGSQNISAQQRFNINQGNSTIRPIRFSAWVKGNVTSPEGETPNCSIVLELWDDTNTQFYAETIELPVGEYDWTEVARDIIPSDPISYGRVTLRILGVSGWVAFDQVTLTEIPESHLVYDEEDAVSDVLAHDIEIDYQPNKDFIDWSPSGFAPVADSSYTADIASWPVRIDSCQIDTGGNLNIYTGSEGQTDYGPEKQNLSHVIAEIVVRGDRPIVSADDGYNSYITDKAVQEFTGEEGIEHRATIGALETSVGATFLYGIVWGLIPALSDDEKSIKVSPGEFEIKDTKHELKTFESIAGTEEMDTGWYYLCIDVDSNDVPVLSLVSFSDGWPQNKVVIAKAFWHGSEYQSGSGLIFGQLDDLRHLHFVPHRIDDEKRGLDAGLFQEGVSIDLFDFRDTVGPAAPVMYEPLAGDQKLELSWQASGDPTIAGYRIYRATSRTGTYTAIDSVEPNTTTYTDYPITNGTTYWYKVAAISSDGVESNISDLTDPDTNDYDQPQNGSPLAVAPPKAPVNVTATGGDHQVSISWDEVTQTELGESISPACTYVVYRSCSEEGGSSTGPWMRVNNQLVEGTTFLDTSLRNGYTFYYAVSAVREDNVVSELSTAAEASTVAGEEIVTEGQPTAPELTVEKGSSWGNADDFESAHSLVNATIVSPQTTGELSFVPPSLTPLSGGNDYSVNVGFAVDNASVSIKRLLGGEALQDNSLYDSYYDTQWPTPFDELDELGDGCWYYEDISFENNGQWFQETLTVDSEYNIQLSNYPIEPGSCIFHYHTPLSEDTYVYNETTVPSVAWEPNYETGEMYEMLKSPGDEIVVRYQTRKTRHNIASYPISSVVKIRNMTTGETLVEDTDYEVVGELVHFINLPDGVLRFIYELDLSRMEDEVWANISDTSGETFDINFSAPDGWQIDLQWSASNNGMLRVTTPDVLYYGEGEYGYLGYEPGFEAQATEEANAYYIGDSHVDGNNWTSLHFDAISEDRSGTQTLQVRVRAADTVGGLGAAAWSSWSDVASGEATEVSISATGRYLEVEIYMLAHDDGGGWVSPYVSSLWAEASSSYLSWTEPTQDTTGNSITVDGYKLYRREAGGNEELIQQPSGNSYTYTTNVNASFRVLAVSGDIDGLLSYEQFNVPSYNVPSAANSVSAAMSVNGVRVSWDVVELFESTDKYATLNGYDVFRRVGSGSWVKLNSSPISATYYDDADVVDGGSYTYSVRAISGDNQEGVRSNTSSVNSIEIANSVYDPEEDTFIDSQQIDAEFSSAHYLRVSKDGSKRAHAFTKLRTHLVDTSRGRGDVIDAQLNVMISGMHETEDCVMSIMYQADTSIVGFGNYTWSNRDSISYGDKIGTVTIPAGTSGAYAIDITEAVREWLHNTYSNESTKDKGQIALVIEDGQNDSWVEFNSIDASSGQPTVSVKFADMQVAPSAPDNLSIYAGRTMVSEWGDEWGAEHRKPEAVLNWQAVDDLTVQRYHVYRSDNYGDLQKIGSTQGTTFTDEIDISSNTSDPGYYIYAVRAVSLSDTRTQEMESTNSRLVAMDWGSPAGIIPTKDANVNGGGTGEEKWLDIYPNGPGVMIQFDLSELSIPTGSDICLARLSQPLYNTNIHLATESWTESSVEANASAPAHETMAAASTDYHDDSWHGVFVRRWLEGDTDNYGLFLHSYGGIWPFNLLSRESENPVELRVQYIHADNNPSTGVMSAQYDNLSAATLHAASIRDHVAYKEFIENPQRNWFGAEIIPLPEELSANLAQEDYEAIRVPDDSNVFEHQASSTSNIPVLVCKFDIADAFDWITTNDESGDNYYPYNLSGISGMVSGPDRFAPIRRLRAVWRGYCDAEDPSSTEQHVARVFMWNWMHNRWDHGEQQDSFTFERQLQNCFMDARSTDGTVEQYINEGDEVFIAIMPTRLNQRLDLKLVSDYVGLMVCFGVNEVGGQFVIDDGDTEKLVGITSGIVGSTETTHSQLNVFIGEAFGRDSDNAVFTEPPAIVVQARRQDNNEPVDITVEPSSDMPMNAFMITIEGVADTQATPVVVHWTATGR